MCNTTSIQIKYAGEIPYESEIISFLKRVFRSSMRKIFPGKTLSPKHYQIIHAVKEKPLYLNVVFQHEINSIATPALRSMKGFFRKDVVAVMRTGQNEFVLVLL